MSRSEFTNYYTVTTTMIKRSIPIRLREIEGLKAMAEHGLKKEKQRASNRLFDERWDSAIWRWTVGWFMSEDDLRKWADENPQEVLGMFEGWHCANVIRALESTVENLNILMKNAENHADDRPVDVLLRQQRHLIVFTTHTTDRIMEELEGYLPVDVAP